MKHFKAFLLLFTIFIAALIVGNVIAGKIVKFLFWIVPTAVFVYPITFIMTDVISEIWGKKKAQEVVWLGFLANLVLIFFIQLAIQLKPASFYKLNNEFKLILGGAWRIVFASLVAYVVAQSHDVWAFHFWKKKTNGKYLWLRNNFSTLISQLLDTVIFIPLAFLGNVPSNVILVMIFSQYSLKLIIALLDTPVVYLIVKLITGKWIIKEENI